MGEELSKKLSYIFKHENEQEAHIFEQTEGNFDETWIWGQILRGKKSNFFYFILQTTMNETE